jgi:hypothetical protein
MLWKARGTVTVSTNMEMIQAIAGLWKLVLAIAILVGVILAGTLFRKEVRSFFQQLKHFRFKRGQTEVSVDHRERQEEKIEAAADKRDLPSANTPDAAEKRAESAAEKAPESEDWEVNMYLAFVEEEDLTKAKAAYEKLQEGETSEAKRIQNEAIFLYWTFRSGDVTAQTRLQNLEQKAREWPDVLAEVRRWDAFCFRLAGDRKRAIARFREAAGVARSPLLWAQNLRSAAAILAECESRAEAENLLITSLEKSKDIDAKAELYLGLADLYESVSVEDRALMLEKVLQLRPMDKDTQFAAGYAYSNAGINGLAAAHYENTLSISSKQEMATNNLGVALTQLELTGLAFEKYKKSVELGGTLAASNLALRFIEAGAYKEAEAVLTEARKTEEVHQNVFSTSTKLQNLKREEREQIVKVRVAAEKHKSFLLKYADAMLRRDEWVAPGGEWKLTTGKAGNVKLEGSKLEVTWTEDEGDGIFRKQVQHRFRGEQRGRVAKGSFERLKPAYDFKNPKAGVFEKYGNGHAYFDDRKLLVAGTNSAENEFKSLEFVCKENPTVPL